jgi:two-component sensor histidine kinase
LAGLAFVLALAALGLWLGASMLHLQLMLLAAVLTVALLLGTAAGVVGATVGFGALLWRGLSPAGAGGGGWSLDLPTVLDAFLWFALAKLTAALVAAPRALVARLAAARAEAETEAQRRGLLVGEMTHRVANDLQRVSGLLDAQARSDPAASGSLLAAAGRVRVLGRLHHRLTLRGAAAEVDSRRFLEEIVEDLRAAAGAGAQVVVTIAAEPHPLPLAAAADLGLVVNELVTNALKHAFPGGRAGAVRVRFRLAEDGATYVLEVADDGAGLPGGLAFGSAPAARREAAGARGGGFGARLVRALAAQLGGRVEARSGQVGGTQVDLRFPVPPRAAANDAAASGLDEERGRPPTPLQAPAERRGTGTGG